MSYIMSVVLLSITSYLLMCMSIAFIQKYDKEHGITFRKKEKVCSLIILFILFNILQVKYSNTLFFYFSGYITCYLFICSLIDYQVKKVYDFYHYITIVVGIMYRFLIGSWVDIDIINIIINYFVQIAFFAIVIILFSKLGAFGSGDGFLLSALLPFLIRPDIMESIEILCTLILLANGIFVISNFKHLNIRKLKMKDSLPFVPSLAVSTFLILIIY